MASRANRASRAHLPVVGPDTARSLADEIVRCGACPRLVAWRERVARDKVVRFRDFDYWGRPVPGFGDRGARILIVGLAPGAHGANRTGRMFTGDRSGDFLFAALHRAGLASQPMSRARDDGLLLNDTYIVASVRCAPPGNAPAKDELARCAPFLDREIALLPHVRVVVALGAVAWRAYLEHLARLGLALPRPRPAFGHGAVFEPDERAIASQSSAAPAAPRAAARPVVGSYHVSQQNTQTGKLTPAMFDSILRKALEKARSG